MAARNRPGKLLRLTTLEALNQAAECLKTLAHPHRLRMVQMLLQGKYTVGELAEACDIPSHMASEHLRLMQRCGFLAPERDGRSVYYRVADESLSDLCSLVCGNVRRHHERRRILDSLHAHGRRRVARQQKRGPRAVDGARPSGA